VRDVAWLLNARARSNLLHRPVGGGPPGKGTAAVAEVVRGVAGVQAQLPSGAALAVRSRSTATRWSDVDTARLDDRSIVRGWFMRGTLHLVATEDFGWLLDLFAPVVVARTERRYRELGLSPSTRERSLEVLGMELVRHGPLDRGEIAEALLRAGLITETHGQAVYALIHHAGLHGVLCYGPDRDNAETWVATSDWLDLPPKHRPSDPFTELARRYLTAYGPASPHDFATWSGLPVSVSRKAFGSLEGITDVQVGDSTFASLDPDPPADPIGVRLLGPFDPYLLGYRDRDLAVDPAFRRQVNAGGGMIAPVILSDGRAIGTWRPHPKTPAIDLFDPSGPDLSADLDAELADVVRFDDHTRRRMSSSKR
jgi:hypothetical protein